MNITRRAFTFGATSAAIAAHPALSSTSNKVSSVEGYASFHLPEVIDVNDPSLQCFAFDDAGKEVFVQFSTRETPPRAFIVRYSVQPWSPLTPLDIQDPSELIGHQGLTIEHRPDGTMKLWTSGSGRGYSAIRFNYTPGANPPTIENYKLFDYSFAPTALTLAISYDQRWLIATSRARRGEGARFIARVFDFQKLTRFGPGDYSSQYVYQWSIPLASGIPIQGLACKADVVSVVCGGSNRSKPKPLMRFSIDGNPIWQLSDLRVGKEASQPGWSYEPEGLCYSCIDGQQEPSLLVGITMGRPGTRIRKVYVL